VGQDDLRRLLSNLPASAHSHDLLVGYATNDDAAVFRIDDRGRAIVQTVDFFTPIVDDPELFGEIAAANSVSDVYAMGAEPIIGLAIAAFPTKKLPMSTLEAILRGGVRKAEEAGFPIAGGHTIIDDVPKYGLVVTGIVDVDKVVRNSTARAGDLLYLTKPLGNGILVSAHRAANVRGLRRLMRRTEGPDLSEAINWMTTLNRDAARAMVACGVSAATDVTGYGLIGHLLEMCRGASIGARLTMDAMPMLRGVRELYGKGFYPDGSVRNADAFRGSVSLEGTTEDDFRILCDAQTSGGLLISIGRDRGPDLEARLEKDGLFYARIGEMTDRSGLIEIRN